MNREWHVNILASLIKELRDSFQGGPIIDDEGRRRLDEELVDHLNGLIIHIFSGEHPPPHFRVKYAGETANYTIKDCTQINGGLKKWYRNIKKWHSNNKEKLIEIWDKTKPTDCPVGKYQE